MKTLLIRFWQWLGRLLGLMEEDVRQAILKAAEEQPTADQPHTSPDSPAGGTAAPQVTLPPPMPPQLDIHAGEAAQFGRKSSLVTKPEGKLYRSLLSAARGDYQVMSKVRLGDFLWLVNEPPNRKEHLSRLFCRHVDFLLCEPLTLKPLLVIELDDKSHQQPRAIADDRYKDELFAAARLPILRLDNPDYLPRQLRERIEQKLSNF